MWRSMRRALADRVEEMRRERCVRNAFIENCI
jgi:hypothetical protein